MIRVPATSANLGPGFDALGMALTLYVEAGLDGVDPMPDGAKVANDSHPTHGAFLRAGGTGRTWVRTNIPMGRGLGSSGAARVAGVVAAEIQRDGGWDPNTSHALSICSELEGHADNVAASLAGGIVATAGGRIVRVPCALEVMMVVWVPSYTTSTSESRRTIGPTIALEDAVFNIGRTALLVAALASGDVGALREATQDRLHQDRRLAAVPLSRAALDAGLAAGAMCGWLSGSGPTIALMCDPSSADAVAASLSTDGEAKVVAIDQSGVVVS